MAQNSRKRLLHLLCGCTVALAAALAASAPASAATFCDGFLPPGTYRSVVVPAGGACFAAAPIMIGGGLTVEPGGSFLLGDEETPGGNGSIAGGVHATNPANVQIHFTTILDGIDIEGGAGPFGGPFGITWNAIEDNKIFGNVNIDGYDGFWFGFIRNHVQGAVNLNDNVLLDPDGNEYVTNVIRGSLNCEGNSPAPQIGDSEGLPNRVIGKKTGQCAGL